MHKKLNIILIGHKSAGKSTVGIALSRHLHYALMDIDEQLCLLHGYPGETSADLYQRNGEKQFRHWESRFIQQLHCINHVIVTGGGALLDHNSAEKLKQLGQLVYLQVDFPILQQRNLHREQQGILAEQHDAMNQYTLRDKIFRRYADKIVNCSNQTVEKIVESSY